ncbi:hypothetical protein KBI52_06380 [Microvirga sp. HBU67558]|uniref:hypothetical protein n=1 Tax=Microvirga TaxID=186650 RepID=UPI001B37521B|nr:MULTISPECIES: hypothetical protein [unclassified Microvirga]MBQ0819847.1 hypothetical protein [Microvirga sp. HBU67558]
MALTSKDIEGDLLMLRIMFPDGTTVTMTADGNSRSVSVAPDDREIAARLTSLLHWSSDRVGEPGYPFTSLNQVIYGIETLARSAMSVEQFIEGLREVLEVSNKHPMPEVSVRTPSLTVVDLSPSRNGWFIDARFQSGERFKLAINKASIGWVAVPRDPTRDQEVMKVLSGVKGARVASDEDLALLVMEVAHYSTDIARWLHDLHSAISETLKP